MRAWIAVGGVVACVGLLALAGDAPVGDRALIDALTKRVDELTVRLMALERGTNDAKVAQFITQAGAVVHAGQFILEDAKGKSRGVFQVVRDEPFLSMMDKNGKVRLFLTVDEQGPELMFADENGNPRILVKLQKDGPSVALFVEKAKAPRVGLSVFRNQGLLAIVDANGNPVWAVP